MILVKTVIHLGRNKETSITVSSELTRLLMVSEAVTPKIYLSRKFIRDNVTMANSNTTSDRMSPNEINELLKRHRRRIVPKKRTHYDAKPYNRRND